MKNQNMCAQNNVKFANESVENINSRRIQNKGSGYLHARHLNVWRMSTKIVASLLKETLKESGEAQLT